MSYPSQQPYTFDRVVRLGASILLLAGLFFLLGYLSDVLAPFAIALLLAYLINPLVEFFEYRTPLRSRVLAVGVSLLLVFLGMVALFFLFVPVLIGQVIHMGELVTNYVNNSALREQLVHYLPSNFNTFLQEFINRPDVRDFLTGNWGNIATAAKDYVLPGIWKLFSGSLGILVALFEVVILLLYLVFILLDYERIAEGWSALLPITYRETVISFVGDVSASMNTYFRAQMLVAVIVGVLHAIGFSIIGLPMGIALGLLIGVLGIVPYLHIAGLVPALFFAAIHALEIGNNVWVAMSLVLLVTGIIQIIQDAILTPRIMGNATGLNPAIIMLSLSIWGKLLGMLGLIIAIPMTTVLIAYYRRFVHSVELQHNKAVERGTAKPWHRKPYTEKELAAIPSIDPLSDTNTDNVAPPQK